MKLNIFEGARRISLLIGALWTVGWVSYAIFSEPDSHVTYTVQPQIDKPQIDYTALAAQYGGKTEPVDYAKLAAQYGGTTEANDTPVVKPAAPTQPANTQANRYDSMSDAELMSAYQKSKSPAPLSGGKKTYSIEEVMGNAAPAQPAAPEQASERKNRLWSEESSHRKALLKQWGVAAMFLFGGLVAGWGIVAAIGWIVRGFMGIPRGQDMRPTP